ncbi:MAG: serine/threonine protein kinase, partial [Myxococcota bacterium]
APHPVQWAHCPISGEGLRVESSIGRTLAERYRIMGVLGEGGMGTVFRAEHLASGRKVALKQLRPEQSFDSTAVERFQRETRAATATGHKNVVKVLDVGFDELGAPFIVMELLTGVTLAERLRDRGRLSVGETVEVACQILAGLDAVHAQNIVHRDLKPGNIFMTPHGLKILDFGISKFHAGELLEQTAITRTGATMGTPHYMSPEQARGARGIDHRADIYALGVILHEALSGKRPYATDNYHALLREIISGERPRLDRSLGVPQPVSDAVHRAMQSDPRTRFQTAREMRDALQIYRPHARPSDWSALRPSKPPPSFSPPMADGASPYMSPSPSPEGYRSPYAAPELAQESYPSASAAAGSDTAKVKGRLVLSLARYSLDLKRAVSVVGALLPLSWIPQDALESALVVVNFDSLREAGSSAASELMENLAWAAAPGHRVLGRLPALHRAFFSGNDIRVEETDLCFSGGLLGPRLSEVMAGFYEYALARAKVSATITIRADRLSVTLPEPAFA